MPLAAAVLVELNTSCSRSVGDIANGDRGADCINVNRARPKVRAISGSEYIHFTAAVAQIHFQPISCGETRAGEMQHHQLGPCGCRSVGEVNGPGIRTGRWPKIGPYFQDRRDWLHGSRNVRHNVPFFLEPLPPSWIQAIAPDGCPSEDPTPRTSSGRLKIR